MWLENENVTVWLEIDSSPPTFDFRQVRRAVEKTLGRPTQMLIMAIGNMEGLTKQQRIGLSSSAICIQHTHFVVKDLLDAVNSLRLELQRYSNMKEPGSLVVFSNNPEVDGKLPHLTSNVTGYPKYHVSKRLWSELSGSEKEVEVFESACEEEVEEKKKMTPHKWYCVLCDVGFPVHKSFWSHVKSFDHKKEHKMFLRETQMIERRRAEEENAEEWMMFSKVVIENTKKTDDRERQMIESENAEDWTMFRGVVLEDSNMRRAMWKQEDAECSRTDMQREEDDASWMMFLG